jgi:SlyX protein
MADELIELQTRVAFQEQALEEMNLIVTRQQDQIDHLRRELGLLKDQYEDLQLQAPGAAASQEKPPHY